MPTGHVHARDLRVYCAERNVGGISDDRRRTRQASGRCSLGEELGYALLEASNQLKSLVAIGFAW